MRAANYLSRFHLVMDTIDQVSQTGAPGFALKHHLEHKLIEHRQYIEKHGQDLLEVRNWMWSAPATRDGQR